MNATIQDLMHVALIGILATALMDAWLLVLKQLHVPTLNFALIGRWIGHLRHGRWAHDAIAKAAPIPGELALGWITHYAAGVAFAALLMAIQGMSWARTPSLLPALAVGIATVVVPLFVMQPAMGAGMASSKTPAPLKNCLRSVANHTVFGAGMYLAAVTIAIVVGWASQ